MHIQCSWPDRSGTGVLFPFSKILKGSRLEKAVSDKSVMKFENPRRTWIRRHRHPTIVEGEHRAYSIFNLHAEDCRSRDVESETKW